MISSFQARNFRCVREARLDLTPLHALIGPNDSGKSTLLEGLDHVLKGARVGSETELHVRGEHASLRLSPAGAVATLNDKDAPQDNVVRALKGARFVRFSADQLRAPSQLVSGPEPTLDDRGAGLASVLDAVLSYDREAWDQIEASVRRLFPTVHRIRLPVVGKGTKAVAVELSNKVVVDASAMSEGLLYWLGFEALAHSSVPGLLLVEEPENGLHPSRIADVMRSLRAMTERGVQVVLATHSPLVVNELRPEEVSVVTRTEAHGTRVRRVTQIPDLDRLLSAFSLGELWLAFADGKQEESLFAGGARA